MPDNSAVDRSDSSTASTSRREAPPLADGRRWDDVTSAVDSADATRQQDHQGHEQGREQDGRPTSRRVWLVIALGLVLAGAFTVSATSTWKLGDHHHLDELARYALILMLEVGSVTGASIYVITRQTGTRTRAGLVVAIATGVGATGGVQAYGFLIGLPVAALLLLLVDLIAKFWHESTATAASAAAVADRLEGAGDGAPVAAVSRLGAWWRALGAVEQVTTSAASGSDSTPDVDTSSDSAGDEPDTDELDREDDDQDEPAPLPEVRGVEPHIVAQAAELLEREPGAGRPRIRAYTGLTDHKAGLVLAALRPRPLNAVGSEAS